MMTTPKPEPVDLAVRVVVFAYACEPDKGSEPGAAWGVVEAVSEFASCTVLVAPEHTQAIERYQAGHATTGRRFVEVSEPWWAKYAKWHRIPWFLAYAAWLRRARREARRLHAIDAFDVAHHVSYSVFWLPSPVGDLGVPSVWGPVGGAVGTPWRLWPMLGWRGVLDELLDAIAVTAMSWLPSTRRTAKQASVVLAQNEQTRRRLPKAVRDSAILLNHAVFTSEPKYVSTNGPTDVLWVSRLEARKGVRLAVMALAESGPEVRLTMVGVGPERAAVERLAHKLGVDDRLDLRGWVDHAEVFDLMASARAVVFTGLREEGGVGLAEALAMGAPVVVVAHGGAKLLAERVVDPSRVRLVTPTSPQATARAIGVAMTELADVADSGRTSLIDRRGAVDALVSAFATALSRPIETDR